MLDKIKKFFAPSSGGHSGSSDQLYLANLEFRPELRKSWLNFFVTNFRTVILMIGFLTVIGVYSFVTLPRESTPEVKIPYAMVMTAYPGASPVDVEEQVTKKIETEIGSLPGVKTITSSSSNGLSSITVEFDAGEDLDESLRSLSDKVRDAEAGLPDDATSPIVQEISMTDTPVISVALTGSVDGYTLRQNAEEIAERLEQLSGVREVRVSGGETREFEVAYDPASLNRFGISINAANGAVQSVNLGMPSGRFEGERYVYPVRSESRVWTAEELGRIPVKFGQQGETIYLSDVATVREVAVDPDVYSRVSLAGGTSRAAVSLEVLKRTGGSVFDVADNSKNLIEESVSAMPGIAYDITLDMADLIEEDFDQLQHDFLLTLFMVFTILLLLIGLKEAFVAGLAIPLVFFATFVVMKFDGLSLNFLSVFALLLSLGMLVDDAIVVVSATKMYLRTGKYTPEEAVLLVLNDFKVVLTTTTLTTVWAFLPLVLATGIIGSYIRVIPVAVSVTLIASLLIALMINHPLAAVLERLRMTRRWFWLLYVSLLTAAIGLALTGQIVGYVISGLIVVLVVVMIRWYYRNGRETLKANAALARAEWKDDELIKRKLKSAGNHVDRTWLDRIMHGFFSLDAIIPSYDNFLRKILASRQSRKKAVLVAVALLAFAVCLPIFGIVRSEFFPDADSTQVYVNYTGPVGLKLSETDKEARKVESYLRDLPEIKNFQTYVGSSRSSYGSGGAASSNFSVVVNLVDEEKRDVASYKFAEKLRSELPGFVTEGTISVESESGGPPTGSSFEATISGDDMIGLEKISRRLKQELQSIPGVVDADISISPAPSEFTFNLDPERLASKGLTAAQVSGVLRTAVTGTEITKVLRDDGEIKVMARVSEDKIKSLDDLQSLQLLNNFGQTVYLKDVAEVELTPSVQAIRRVDQKRSVTLSSGVQASVLPAEVLAEFTKRLDANPDLLPDGYSITYGGENEQNEESVMSILKAMLLAIFLIGATLIVQFNSFRQMMVVLVAIPLSLIGVFIGLAITGISLSFPGLVGVLALFGIVTKNSIILVDKMNLNVRSGIPFMEAVVDAGKSRLEAIFITSICTIFGIIPVTLSNAMWQSLGSAIIFGLMVSSFMTLFIVPTVYVMLEHHEE